MIVIIDKIWMVRVIEWFLKNIIDKIIAGNHVRKAFKTTSLIPRLMKNPNNIKIKIATKDWKKTLIKEKLSNNAIIIAPPVIIENGNNNVIARPIEPWCGCEYNHLEIDCVTFILLMPICEWKKG